MRCKFCVILAGPFQGLSDKGIEEMVLKCTVKSVPPTLGWQPSSTHPLHGLGWDCGYVGRKSWILAPPDPFFAVCTCSTWASTFSFANWRTTSLDSWSVTLDIKWSAVCEGVCQVWITQTWETKMAVRLTAFLNNVWSKEQELVPSFTTQPSG